MPATDEMFEPEAPGVEDSVDEARACLQRLNQNMEQLLVTMDGLTADGADSRSMLERLTEGLLDDPKAANRAGQIEDRIRVHTADFHRWVEKDRRWRRWVPVAATGIAMPAAVLLGLLIEQHYQVIPIHDPTGGWRGHVWEQYGRRIVDCAAEARSDRGRGELPARGSEAVMRSGRSRIEMSGMATVVNMKDRPDLRAALDGKEEHGDVVRIDRRTRWGNPFVIGRHGNREEVIERYRAWLWRKVKERRDILCRSSRP